MGFFDNLGKNVQNISQATVNKTKEIADITKLSSQINENKNKINQLYMEIGMKYCDMVGNDTNAPMFDLVTAIRHMLIENNERTEKIQELKGYIRCTYCGQYIAKETSFCTYCGNRVVPDDVIQCPRCNSFMKKDQLFCQKCGARVDEMMGAIHLEEEVEAEPIICKVCNSSVAPGNLFCKTCGTKVIVDEEE